MFSIQNITLFVTILFSGLIAGLLFSYSCSVNVGLKNLQDEQYIHAMQSINEGIQNAVFFTCFMGLLLLLPLAAWFHYSKPVTITFYWLLIAALLYIIGVFGITVAGNVPLNNQLAAFKISSATASEISAMRQTFEPGWNKFHLVRTVCAIVSFACTIVSLFYKAPFNA